MSCVLFRGRFQPFTKLHYECIKGFYIGHVREKVRKKESPPDLALCVVRDYEMLASAHKLLQRHRPGSRHFRHLYFLNPLTLRECFTQIREGIFYFWRHDPDFFSYPGETAEEICEREYFSRYLTENLAIVSAPIKFLELISVLEGGHEKVIEEIQFVLSQDDKPLDELSRRLIHLLVHLASENLGFIDQPSPGDISWLIPAFDSEDLLDYRRLLDAKQSALLYFHPNPHEAVFRMKLSELPRFRLSHYGAFIYYIYLMLARSRQRLQAKSADAEIRRGRRLYEGACQPRLPCSIRKQSEGDLAAVWQTTKLRKMFWRLLTISLHFLTWSSCTCAFLTKTTLTR